ncbi:hypothetical protein HDU96_009606 [Phlyctochytrium bullatum]|nr:hypothetical protein HDU96_009606 [Phlyctochytrium bullatum]
MTTPAAPPVVVVSDDPSARRFPTRTAASETTGRRRVVPEDGGDDKGFYSTFRKISTAVLAGPRKGSIPFIVLVTLEIFLICGISNGLLLVLSNATATTSHALCTTQSLRSAHAFADALQQSLADETLRSLASLFHEPARLVRESARLHGVGMLTARDYDVLWRHFWAQMREVEAPVSLVYFGEAMTRDFVGVRVFGTDGAGAKVFGVDLMNEEGARCPRTCPASMPSPGSKMRSKYVLDASGNIADPSNPYEVAPFDPTTRQWFRNATAQQGSRIVWTPAYAFARQNGRTDLAPFPQGVTVAVQVFDPVDPRKVQGVFGADMSFGILQPHLQALPLTPNGFALIFDSAGNLFGSSLPGENVTTSLPAGDAGSGGPRTTTAIKSVTQLVDPRSRWAVEKLLGTAAGGNPAGLPANASFRFVRPVPDGEEEVAVRLVSVEVGVGLRLTVMLGAPIRDYLAGADETNAMLAERLRVGNRWIVAAGVGVMVTFIGLSVPLFYWSVGRPLIVLSRNMEEVAKFDFHSLQQEKRRNARSYIRELSLMQSTYWNMVKNFAEALARNRAL